MDHIELARRGGQAIKKQHGTIYFEYLRSLRGVPKSKRVTFQQWLKGRKRKK